MTGPITWSIILQRNSMVLHSLDKVHSQGCRFEQCDTNDIQPHIACSLPTDIERVVLLFGDTTRRLAIQNRWFGGVQNYCSGCQCTTHHHLARAQMTSLAMHTSPAVAAWCMRWRPRGEWVPPPGTPAADSWDRASLVQLCLLPMLPYLLWFGWYYAVVGWGHWLCVTELWLCVTELCLCFPQSHLVLRYLCSRQRRLPKTITPLSTRCGTESHTTVLGVRDTHHCAWRERHSPPTQLMTKSPTSPITKFVKLAPEPLQPLMYMSGHAFWTWVSLLVTPLWWHSCIAHTAFLVLCLLMSFYNGASYYFEVFATRYMKELEENKED